MRRKRRSTNMKSELGQSVDHFKRAAAIAAQETSSTVGPKFSAARDRVQPAATKAKGAATSSWDSALATLTPLVAAATESARQSNEKVAKVGKKAAKDNRKSAKKLEKHAAKALNRKSSGRRSSRLIGLALIGGAVGAGAAYVLRRRQAAQWDEYEPSRPVTSTTTAGGADDAAFEPADSTAYTRSAGSDSTTVVTDTTDQTSSTQHSPTVARLAGGQNPNGTTKN
jgi:hypothetical protein